MGGEVTETNAIPVTLGTLAAQVAALIAGDSGFYVQKSLNGSDFANVATVRTNLGLGTLAQQAASAVAITGGTINGTVIGATTAANGHFSNVMAGDAFAMPAAPRRFTAYVAQSIASPGAVYRWGGTVSGTLASSLTGYYATVLDSDVLQFSNTGQGMTLVYQGHALSAGWSGGRTTQQSFLTINGAGVAGQAAYHVSGSSFAQSSAEFGGVTGDNRGNLFGRNDQAYVAGGSGYHVLSAFGNETDIAVASNAAVEWKCGIKVVQRSFDAVRGTIADYAFSMSNGSSGAPPGWRVGFAWGGYEGWWPFTTSSRLSGLVRSSLSISPGAPPYAAGRGIDLTGIAMSDAAFASDRFRVDGGGNVGATKLSGETLQTRSSILAKTAVVSAIDVLEGGLFTGDVAITIPAPGGSGTAATATPGTVSIPLIAAVNSRGTGYAVGDTFTLTGGTYGTQAVGEITKVGSGGAVYGVRMTEPGSYSVVPTSPVATTATSGAGSGLTVTPAVQLLTVTVTGGGSNYAEHAHPEPTTAGSGTTFRQAMLKVSMTATPADLDLSNAGNATKVTTIKVGSNQVVAGRQTGWTAPTGTLSRGTFDQSTVTLPQLAQRVAALITDLTTHGLVGA